MNGMRFVFADSGKAIDASVAKQLMNAYAPSSMALSLLMRDRLPMGWGLFDEVMRYAILARMVAYSEPFDVIHAHDWLSIAAGMEAKRISGKPLIVHMHATEFDRTGGTANDAVYEIERTGMEAADRVVAVSDYTKNIIINRYGITPEKIEVVYNGIDPDDAVVAAPFASISARKRLGEKIVLCVGRLTLQKGPDYFLRAAKRALSKDPRLQFVISGAGDMQERLMQEAAALGIADRVFFVGFLRGAELASAYRMADVVVMPSVSEPFGIVPLESLLNGTPVILSKQSGVSEVIRHALKVDFWDTDAMAERIIAATRYSALSTTLSENGRREAGLVNWQKAAQQCILIYNRIRGLLRP